MVRIAYSKTNKIRKIRDIELLWRRENSHVGNYVRLLVATSDCQHIPSTLYAAIRNYTHGKYLINIKNHQLLNCFIETLKANDAATTRIPHNSHHMLCICVHNGSEIANENSIVKYEFHNVPRVSRSTYRAHKRRTFWNANLLCCLSLAFVLILMLSTWCTWS